MDERKADSDAKEIAIFSPENLDEIEIAFDHEEIIKDCLKVEKNRL
jgi:8-oxo-dGTP diphosphatase